MAFQRRILQELNGFDPVLSSAEDVDFGWRVLEKGHEVGYHPAAFIWHRRREGIRPYLRQQRNYGRGQALTQRRYPERFPVLTRFGGLGSIVRSVQARRKPNASYPVAYRSICWQDRPFIDLLHRGGVPLVIVLLCTAPLSLIHVALVVPAVAAASFVLALSCLDFALAGGGARMPQREIRARLWVAACQLLKPLAFQWGKWSEGISVRIKRPVWPPRPDQMLGPRREGVPG
jgi:hypothetical protein